MRICRAIEISASGYYKWRKSHLSKRKREDEKLLKDIKKHHELSYRIYGSPRIEIELRKSGIKTSKKRVARIMQENGIRSRIKRKFKSTTNSNHKLPIAKNLLMQNFSVTNLDSLWTSDITGIWTKEGWLFLVIILEVKTRQIISWKVSNNLGKSFVVEATSMAIKIRKPKEPLIFHSDQGVQYASLEMRKLLSTNNITQSMSKRGDCFDNAITETFFHSLKTEWVYQTTYETRKEAEMSLFIYIELFYNRKRLHSSLNYNSPIDYEKKFLQST